jgi:hypothetical protein
VTAPAPLVSIKITELRDENDVVLNPSQPLPAHFFVTGTTSEMDASLDGVPFHIDCRLTQGIPYPPDGTVLDHVAPSLFFFEGLPAGSSITKWGPMEFKAPAPKGTRVRLEAMLVFDFDDHSRLCDTDEMMVKFS